MELTTNVCLKAYDSPEELRLIHRAKSGDEDAFRALYDMHHGRVFMIIKRMLSGSDATQWVVNITFTQIWKNLTRFQEKSKFSTWITRIAINEARMHLRTEKSCQRQREVSLDSMLERRDDKEHDPSANTRWLATRDLELAGVVDRLLLERAITNVPQQYREILRFRFWEGLSMREIQAKMSVGEPELVSIPALKTRILRGRSELKKQVKLIS
jgi:RNA polymerase sigma-70 factor (ECF subfamily)